MTTNKRVEGLGIGGFVDVGGGRTEEEPVKDDEEQSAYAAQDAAGKDSEINANVINDVEGEHHEARAELLPQVLDGTIAPIHGLKLRHLLCAEECMTPTRFDHGSKDDASERDEEEDAVDPEKLDVLTKGPGEIDGDETQDSFSESCGTPVEVFVAANDHRIEPLAEA